MTYDTYLMLIFKYGRSLRNSSKEMRPESSSSKSTKMSVGVMLFKRSFILSLLSTYEI
jgi:hypothetical protein